MAPLRVSHTLALAVAVATFTAGVVVDATTIVDLRVSGLGQRDALGVSDEPPFHTRFACAWMRMRMRVLAALWKPRE